LNTVKTLFGIKPTRSVREGAGIVGAELPSLFGDIEDSFQIIATMEGARSMTAELREHLTTMNHWLQDVALAAAAINDAQYEKAQLHAIACQRELHHIFKRCDCIVTPSACGEATPDLFGVTNSAFNRIWTLMHAPCVSIPAFVGPHGMPDPSYNARGRARTYVGGPPYRHGGEPSAGTRDIVS
jgi:Asp-tRNA(Asn)/Glu-tRNA(Gln) amidotransferase A subunit family amidase